MTPLYKQAVQETKIPKDFVKRHLEFRKHLLKSCSKEVKAIVKLAANTPAKDMPEGWTNTPGLKEYTKELSAHECSMDSINALILDKLLELKGITLPEDDNELDALITNDPDLKCVFAEYLTKQV